MIIKDLINKKINYSVENWIVINTDCSYSEYELLSFLLNDNIKIYQDEVFLLYKNNIYSSLKININEYDILLGTTSNGYCFICRTEEIKNKVEIFIFEYKLKEVI